MQPEFMRGVGLMVPFLHNRIHQHKGEDAYEVRSDGALRAILKGILANSIVL